MVCGGNWVGYDETGNEIPKIARAAPPATSRLTEGTTKTKEAALGVRGLTASVRRGTVASDPPESRSDARNDADLQTGASALRRQLRTNKPDDPI